MKLCKKDIEQILELKEKGVWLEGNILKTIEAEEDDLEFKKYLTEASDRDKEVRKKRLDITKQIQGQNRELIRQKEENEQISEQLKEALADAEKAKEAAEHDLDLLQRKTQFELMSTIVKVSLFIIVGIGLTVTGLYAIALLYGKDTHVIGSTWSNLLGILLTNAFSIIGTIMGVKYASETPKQEQNNP